MNLLIETKHVLVDYNLTPDQVTWVGSKDFGWFTWEDFAAVADIEYSDGFGAQEVAQDLVVVGKDWWLERHEYDGSEWWEYKSTPVKPISYCKPNRVIVTEDQIGWKGLKEVNGIEDDV